MDSGLGSDEDRRGRTKEQKQLRNQQLLSGCFIDAASLSDDADVDQRRNDERRQGALVFQSSIPQFSMLQMSSKQLEEEDDDDGLASVGNYVETSTPFNSIVQIEDRKSPLGFYVDLNDVDDVVSDAEPTGTNPKKNIFSMVIDFEAPKKDKPALLSSSYVPRRRVASAKQNGKRNDGGGLSPGPSRGGETQKVNTTDESYLQKSASSLSSSNEDVVANDKRDDNSDKRSDNGTKEDIETTPSQFEESLIDEQQDVAAKDKKNDVKNLPPQPQFVKLSDLECQKTRLDLNLTPRMSRSIPESSWVESALLMSRSAGYRSAAPHPLEPENDDDDDELYDSFASSCSSSRPRKSARRLGTDLLRMFLEEIGPDVTIEVENHKIKAHKCILASRCQYFAAMISGNWLEASGNVISLQGFSYESVYFSLCHIYSGAAHVPDSISVIELASLADMLGLEGLKEVVEHALRQRYCHNFHKPCAGCSTGVTEVLMLSAAYGLDDLYQKCLQWITQHFVKIWPSRGFSSMPRELREKCYQQHVVHMTPDRVLETKTASEKILAMLPNSRWAEPVQQLAQQLVDACHLYHRQHYAAVLVSPSFIVLDSGPAWCVHQVENQMVTAASNLGVEQACRSYSRCCKMLDQSWSRAFEDLLNKIKVTLEQCLVSQADRLIRSNAWLRLESTLRARIKNLTPTSDSSSRLPRGVNSKKVKANVQPTNQSSSDSSRNSSPGMNQNRMLNSSGSPSLRRSLLLAAKAPQVPPSPTINRRSSTLTQPTASSAAKSSKSIQLQQQQQSKLKIPPRRQETKSAPVRKEKPENRTHSPLKVESRCGSPKIIDSRLSSPIKTVRSSSPLKNDSPKKTQISTKLPIPKRNASDSQIVPRTNLITQQRMLKNNAEKAKQVKIAPRIQTKPKKPVKTIRRSPESETRKQNGECDNDNTKKCPSMQRSDTFLKEEPTVIGKLM